MKLAFFKGKINHDDLHAKEGLRLSGKITLPAVPELYIACACDRIQENTNGIMILKKSKNEENYKVFVISNGDYNPYQMILLNPDIMSRFSSEAKKLLKELFIQLKDDMFEVVVREPATTHIIAEIIRLLSEELGVDLSQLTVEVPIFLEEYEQAKHSADIIGRPPHQSQLNIKVEELMQAAEQAYQYLLTVVQPDIYNREMRKFLIEDSKFHVWIDMEQGIGTVVMKGKTVDSNYIKLQTTFNEEYIQYHAYPESRNNFQNANGFSFSISELQSKLDDSDCLTL